jgi:L-lysine exporter family protein LysE/ArgO
MQIIMTFLLGLLVGLLSTIPLGPTSFYVAHNTLLHETRKALTVALGACIVDITYCLVITLGLITLLGPWLKNPTVQIVFSLFLIGYGVRMLVIGRRTVAAGDGPASLRRQSERFEHGHYYVLLGISMTVANPTLFLSWMWTLGILTAHDLLPGSAPNKVLFSIAVGLGSMIWFMSIALFVRSRRHSISREFTRRAGLGTAIVIIGFGLYFIVRAIILLNGVS